MPTLQTLVASTAEVRKLFSWMTAVAIALIAVAACRSTDPAGALPTAGTASTVAISPSIPSETLQQFAYGTPPSAAIVNASAVQGIPLMTHWFTTPTGVLDVTPTGQTRWPTLTPASKDGWTVRLSTARPPTRVQVNLFTGKFNADGSPANEPATADCTHPSTPPACTTRTVSGHVEIQIADRQRPAHVVVYVEWYVPQALRPRGSLNIPVISRSWGFTTGE